MRDERLLNEIIDWAEDIRKSSSETIAPNRIVLDDPTMQIAQQIDFRRLRNRYQEINTKGTYVKASAKVFGGNLLLITESVIHKINEIIEILEVCLLNSRISKEEKHEKAEAQKKLLDSYAEDLIMEAVKIKTKDIS